MKYFRLIHKVDQHIYFWKCDTGQPFWLNQFRNSYATSVSRRSASGFANKADLNNYDWNIFSWRNESKLEVKRSHTSPGSAPVRRGSGCVSAGTLGVQCSSDGVNLPAWGVGIKLSAMSAYSSSHTSRHVLLRLLHPPPRHQIICLPPMLWGFMQQLEPRWIKNDWHVASA